MQVAARLRFAQLLLLLFVSVRATAQYPQIERLTNDDPLYVQLQSEISSAYRALAQEDELPPLLFSRYTVTEGATIFSLAARFSLPYATVATINRIPAPSELEPGREIVVPTIPGVYLPLVPVNDLEHLMSDLRGASVGTIVHVEIAGAPTAFRMFAGDDFSADERKAFLGVLFRHPVAGSAITSPFGNRIHPVSGRWSFHSGVDYGAARGSSVRAARSGTVTGVGEDEVMGRSVTIIHNGGYETFYAHLDTTTVRLNQEVRSGMIIGTVGSTGISTGPHLHFEVRRNGTARDPVDLLPEGAQ